MATDVIHGTGLAPGQAAGPLARPRVDTRRATAASPDLAAAREQVGQQLEQLAEDAGDATHAAMVRAQHAMLLDPEWWEAARQRIADGTPAATAVEETGSAFAAQLAALDDKYLAARAEDIREVARLWAHALSGAASSSAPAGSVVATDRLTVSDLLAGSRAAAYLVHEGSATMHAALIAHNLAIPVVVVPESSALDAVPDGTMVHVDGDRGRVTVGAGAPIGQRRAPIRKGPVPWSDGRMIEVRANIGSAQEARAAAEHGADGVGLFRTELFFEAVGRIPSRQDQIDEYQAAVRDVGGPTCFRTFDLGADKPLAGLTPEAEENPALGQRGMRLYASHESVFFDQLTALIAAAAAGSVEIMFPMVSTLADWRYCRDALAALSAKRPPLAVGVMVEVPSLLFLIPELARAGVDFLSFGTNDLTQYLNAADRGQGGRSGSGSPLAVARAVAHAAAQARAHHVRLAVCGSLAAEPGWAALFAALGVDELSVPVPRIPIVKESLAGAVPAATDRLAALDTHDDEQFLEWLHHA